MLHKDSGKRTQPRVQLQASDKIITYVERGKKWKKEITYLKIYNIVSRVAVNCNWIILEIAAKETKNS